MPGFSIDRLLVGAVGGGLLLFAILWTGNHYGPNAIWRANREAEDKAKNAAIAYLNEHENQVGKEEDSRFAAADKEFAKSKSGLDKCILNAGQTQALQLIGD